MSSTPGDERQEALARHRIQALISQARRVTWPVIALAIFIGAFVWKSVPAPYVVGWILAVILVLGLRWYGLRFIQRRGGPAALRRTAILSAVNGFAHGVPGWLFLPALGLESKAVLTMFLVSQSATAISTSGFYVPAYRLYSWFVLGPLALVWFLSGFPGSQAGAPAVEALYLVVAAFIAAFLFVQEGFARRSEETFIESFNIRYQNEQLLRDLEQQGAALAVERDRAEAASSAKSRFLAAASHDLRQPMHAISLLSGALTLSDLPPAARLTAQKMEEAVVALSSQLDGLLDISKLDAGMVAISKEPTLLAPLLERLHREFSPLAEMKGLQLNVTCGPDLAAATDRKHLERILRNLFDNALKYTQRGSVTVSAVADGAHVRIVIADTGIGIPDAEQERVFEEFYQLNNPERDRARGLGLGLAIVRRLCQLLDIGLVLRSSPGRGTEFELRFDACAGAVAVTDETPLRSGSLAGTRVLIVDDEFAVREGSRRLLEALGCRVAVAGGMVEALNAADEQQFDIVIADYRLRGDESGVALIRELRSRKPNMAALLVSGDTDPERLREADAAGVQLLHKPAGRKALSSAIETAIRLRGDA